VSKKTYHGSFFGTLSLAFMVELHKLLGTWRHKVTTIIALTDFARDKFVAGGILRNHIEVKGNSSREITTCTDECAKYGAVFVGRLTAEKGLSTLLDAWEGVSYPLTIIGDGPMSDDSRLNTISNVYYIGKLPRQEVAEHIRRSAFLILPSEWYEMFPMIIPEAYSTSTPIIAAKIGGLSTLIKPGVTGLHFEPGNASSLKEKVRWAIENAEEMRRFGALARIAYEAEYTAQHNYDNLMTIYRGAIAQKR
jgi:glycosyltransferase involved in cell wall biosynthesis